MIGSLRAEWLKTRKRPATWIALAILAFVYLALGYLLGWVILTHPPPRARFNAPPADLKVSFYPASFALNVLGTGRPMAEAVALILGVLAAGSEFGWDTFKTVFTQRPRRLTAWAAKIVVVGFLCALIALLMFGVAAAASFVLARVDGVSSAWPAAGVILRAMAASWLIYMMWASFGLALATVFRQAALAVGVGLAYFLVVESIVFNLIGLSPSLRDIQRPFPGANATALAESFGRVQVRGLREAATAPLVSALQATLVVALYAAAFLGLASALVQRRDVT